MGLPCSSIAPPAPDWLGEIQPAMRAAPQSGGVEVFNYGRGRQGLIPLWVGEGDLPTPPFIAEAARRLARWLAKRRGFDR